MKKRQRIMVLGACFLLIPAIGLPSFAVWFVYFRCGPTHYSEGYSESRFLRVREGMTADEVEALLGRPLRRIEQADGSWLWTFSDRDDDTCDFEMRWIYLRDGMVQTIVNRHWEE